MSVPPAVLVDIDLKSRWHARLGAVFDRIAHGAGRAGPTARAGVRAFPWLVRMALANPADWRKGWGGADVLKSPGRYADGNGLYLGADRIIRS